MFVNDDLVFLHLQKAAGTFVVNRLAQRLLGTVTGGHAPLYEGKRGRLVAAAIRDPWDWYVSLWSYGCMGQGEVQGRLTADRWRVCQKTLRAVLAGRVAPGEALARLRLDRGRDPAAWREMYASAEDVDLFRRWLRAVLTMPDCGRLPDRYPVLPMRGQVGFMTFRVLWLFTDWMAWQAGADAIRSPTDALDFYRQHRIVDHVLRTERVGADLDWLLATLEGAVPDTVAAEPIEANRLKRRHHGHYYDAETTALVFEKDQMVVEAFGYTPPESAE